MRSKSGKKATAPSKRAPAKPGRASAPGLVAKMITPAEYRAAAERVRRRYRRAYSVLASM